MDRFRSRLLLIALGFDDTLLMPLRDLLERAGISVSQSRPAATVCVLKLSAQLRELASTQDPDTILIACHPEGLKLVDRWLPAFAASVELPVVVAASEDCTPEQLHRVLEAVVMAKT